MSDSEADSIGDTSAISLSLSPSEIRELYQLETDSENEAETQIPDTTTSRRSLRNPDNGGIKSSSKDEQSFLSQAFKKGAKKGSKDWLEIYLDDFHIYLLDKPEQYASLHKVASHNHNRIVQYAFAGKAQHEGGSSLNVNMLGIIGVEIGNFGGFDDEDQPITTSCNNAIYLQTKNSRTRNCYYLLRTPSRRYASIFAAFQWLATFAKYVYDYLEWRSSINQETHLNDFRQYFSDKLKEWHGQDPDFRQWMQRSGGTSDFRRHLACAEHAEFIYDQIHNISEADDDLILSQPVWAEVAPQRLRDTFNYKEVVDRPTLVTSFIQRSFLKAFPWWKSRQGRDEPLLMACDFAPEVLQWRNERSVRLNLGRKSSYDQSKNFESHDNREISIAALLLERASLQLRSSLGVSSDELLGKVVIIYDELKYKYAYVHGLSNEGRGLNVRWLLLPNQTVCEGRTAGSIRARPGTFYPIGNELFCSDQCCCDTVPVYKVVAVHSISILQDHSDAGHDFFVHRQYVSKDSAIVEISEDEIRRCHRHDANGLNRETGSTGTMANPLVQHMTIGRILSLFTGCGGFDSGFERGAEGIFETVFAADTDIAALTSFKLNHPSPHHCEFHNQDVNILFQEIISGKRTPLDVLIMIAGCPCQGFSILNSNRNSDAAWKNCSMAAQTIAWIDLLRPAMVVIENVKEMDPLGPKGGPSAAGQCISTLVAMGYQARIAVIRASDYGGATSRRRLFIIATVPGIPLPQVPLPSHGTDRGLSSLVTASMATLGLPGIHNDTTFINPRHPDHVPYRHLRTLEHDLVSKIPTSSMASHNNLSTLVSRLDSAAEKEWYAKHSTEQKNKTSSAWCRVHPNKPMGTIVTKVNPRCARSDKSLHWLEHRLCSFQEYRLFQGVLDDYILVGTRDQQMHQLGNSVAWFTANVLGKMCAEA